ncbi:MAG: 4-hydroxy-3-methylbut-2-enyl diphosphate reductase [bacterium]|nr:4-hydroxy-3-methylbut-2-enyl diphosphate reductase [bacterium]
MKIIIAKNVGFCSGVKRAILIADKSLQNDPRPIQFLGSLVHNETVIKKFKRDGGKFIKNLKEAKRGTLIIQAHGFPPFKKKLLIRDATCPLVKKVQLIANSLLKEGYKVIIIGDKKHSETKGIKGWCKNKALIVENENQARKLPKFKKIGVVVQTTQNLDNVNQVLKILKTKAEKIKYFNTLCPEVRARQQELNLILGKTDGIIVIGSKSSANTKRLFQICKNYKKPVWWINSFKELKMEDLKNLSVLGVVSGTSTPDWEIKKIRKRLKND